MRGQNIVSSAVIVLWVREYAALCVRSEEESW